MVNKYLLWSIVLAIVVNFSLPLRHLVKDSLVGEAKPVDIDLPKARQLPSEQAVREASDGYAVPLARDESLSIAGSTASEFEDRSEAPVDPFGPSSWRKRDYGTPTDTLNSGAKPIDPFDPATWVVVDYGEYTDTIPRGSTPIHPFDPTTWRSEEGMLLMLGPEDFTASVPVDPFDPDTWGSSEDITSAPSLEDTEPSVPIDPFDPSTW